MNSIGKMILSDSSIGFIQFENDFIDIFYTVFLLVDGGTINPLVTISYRKPYPFDPSSEFEFGLDRDENFPHALNPHIELYFAWTKSSDLLLFINIRALCA